ncbi:MAG: putative sulfate exporter family transporter, partial [Spirochaetia bacterium]|nr:putative sulfate exporter family transporter [Spirochaetia bacterium]
MLKRLSPLPYLPGLSLALALAVLATWLAHFIPSGIISASVIALFLGMVLHTIKQPGKQLQQGIGFASKRLLKIAIVLLGASLDITTIMQVGGRSLMIMLFTLATCFGIGHFVGKALHLNWKMSNLISAGTGICGGSAIAAIAPVIDAEDRDIAFAMSATFLFDMVMILIFPLMGHALGMSDTAYGLWAGTAVNDTSS